MMNEDDINDDEKPFLTFLGHLLHDSVIPFSYL